MKENIKIGLFILLLLIFIFGGYIFTSYIIKEKPHVEKKPEVIKEIKDYRLDKSKDYIYYDEAKNLIASEDITTSKIVINLKDFENLTNDLNEENNRLNNEVKYTKDITIDKDKTVTENEEGIYSINYREYEENTFKDYINLVVKDYTYDIEKGITPIKLKSYVINKNTNKLINEEELLNSFKVNNDIIKEKVKERLTNTQTLVEGENVIKIDDTLNNLENHAISVSKNGHLKVTFIVISEKSIYNDSIEIILEEY